jgi:hypothetical protein
MAMSATDELIERLASDVTPVRRGAVLHRLAAGIGLGVLVSFAGIVAWTGAPLQAVQGTGGAAFAMKLLFSLALFGIALLLLFAAGRPSHDVGKRWLWLLVPLAAVAISAATELQNATPPERAALWMGSTWQTCVTAIALLSLPVFAGLMWAFQRLAPTRLRLAGLLAGLTAGSASAVLYALYCPETTATFLLSWYSLGILAAGLLGFAAGPRLLRW